MIESALLHYISREIETPSCYDHLYLVCVQLTVDVRWLGLIEWTPVRLQAVGYL